MTAGPEEHWTRAASAGEIGEGESMTVMIGDRPVAVFCSGGQYYALDDTCIHRGGSLGRGLFDGEWVACPLHGWKFNVKTGNLAMGPGVACHAARERDGEVEVKIQG